MSKLKNMKLSASEGKEQMPTPAKMDTPRYPYGLRLSLDSVTLKKLGIKELPETGEALVLTARVEVCCTRLNDYEGRKETSMDLQITDMALSYDEKDDTADKLYSEKE